MSGKKLTLEFVKNKTSELTDGKYELLSDEYTNNHTKLEFKCGGGHIYIATWGSFQQKHRCSHCTGKKKKTIEEVKKYIEKFGYKCLSEIYINANSNLEVQCDKGHIYNVAWGDFKREHRCRRCYTENRRMIIKEVKEYIEECGYKCLSNTYINNDTKLELQCNKKHRCKIAWGHFRQGTRCPTCYAENRSGENHPKWKNYSEGDRENLKLYKEEVMKLSNITYIKYFYLINPNKLKRGRNEFHLDHIYSIIDGFNNNVSPEVMASPINLQMLTRIENGSKNGASHMTLEQLYDLHNKFITNIGSEK